MPYIQIHRHADTDTDKDRDTDTDKDRDRQTETERDLNIVFDLRAVWRLLARAHARTQNMHICVYKLNMQDFLSVHFPSFRTWAPSWGGYVHHVCVCVCVCVRARARACAYVRV